MIKVAEIFYSLQGEGMYTGVPSVFLRTFGCNFKCAGFGCPPGKKSKEADQIAERINEFDRYEHLPLVSTGCDSYASWHPAFKHLSPKMEIDEIVDKIVDLLPNKSWRDEHLIITGGEPLLGWQNSFTSLLEHPKMYGLSSITFETNGTQKLTSEFANFIHDKCYYGSLSVAKACVPIVFSVSPKLSCSGESNKDAIKPDVVCSYEEACRTMHGHGGVVYLKWVVSTEEDVQEALEHTRSYQRRGFKGPVYLMPCGGTEGPFNLNKQRVAELALKHGLRYSDRLQVALWKNAWNT